MNVLGKRSLYEAPFCRSVSWLGLDAVLAVGDKIVMRHSQDLNGIFGKSIVICPGFVNPPRLRWHCSSGSSGEESTPTCHSMQRLGRRLAVARL